MREAKWLRALGNTADAVFVVGAAQRIIFWNKGAQRLLGYSAAQVLHRPCHEIIAGRVRDKTWCRADCKVHRMVERGVPIQNFDLVTATRDGKEVWVNVSIITLSRKRQPLTLHLLRDVYRQKQTEAALAHILSTLRLYGLAPVLPEPRKQVPYDPALSPSVTSLLAFLTRREVEVLGLLAQGLSTAELADRLAISPFTVRNHIRNTLRKTGLHSRTQAVSLAVRNNFV